MVLCKDCHRKHDKETPKSAKEKPEVEKVKHRLQLWARPERQNNINSGILNAFLKLKQSGNKCIREEDIQKEPPDIETFKSNFSQMKIIAENNHGKIFDQNGDCIEIWKPVYLLVSEYEKKVFKR
ncbi:MAG: hypothetical protein R1F54_05740 [Candidatus Zeuxoniibacter abyssi]|nr:MAG: hypothetical protein R1F54_05740 [Candidatus Persebacteraceae bacterium AB1(2)]